MEELESCAGCCMMWQYMDFSGIGTTEREKNFFFFSFFFVLFKQQYDFPFSNVYEKTFNCHFLRNKKIWLFGN